MRSLLNIAWKPRIWKDTRGQDLLEYALIAGFIVMVWGAVSLSFATSAVTVFSKVSSTLIKVGS